MIPGLIYLASLTVLICFILVVLAMYNHREMPLMIICIVLFFFAGLGTLIAFVYGWMRAKSWGLTNVMYAYSAGLAVLVIFGQHLRGAFGI